MTVPGTEYVLYTCQRSPIQQANVATEPQDSFRERMILFVFNLLFLLARVDGHSPPLKRCLPNKEMAVVGPCFQPNFL